MEDKTNKNQTDNSESTDIEENTQKNYKHVSDSEIYTLPVKLEADEGFVKIWKFEKIRLNILNYLDIGTLGKLRLTCHEINRAVSFLPLFLDNILYLLLNEEALSIFYKSNVPWKCIRISYWPTHLDFPRNATNDTFIFWENKGLTMEEINLVFPKGNLISHELLLDVLSIPRNLQRISFCCNLTSIQVWNDSDKLKLIQAFSKIVQFTVTGLNNIILTELVQLQMLSLHMLTSFIPNRQLISFCINDGYVIQDNFINMLNDFIVEVVRHHASSLRVFHIMNSIVTCDAMLKICSEQELKLAIISVDLVQTCFDFEKADVEREEFSQTSVEQVQTWRAFIKLIHRSENLRNLSICLFRYNKKIGKKLFPETVQHSLREVFLYSNTFETEESLQILCKLRNLRHLNLEQAGDDICKNLNIRTLMIQDPKSSFFSSLPTSMTSIFLVSLTELTPLCLVVLIQRLHNLIMLKVIASDKMVTDASLQAICQYGKKLKMLHLMPAREITDEGMVGKYNLSSLAGLQELFITHSKITNYSLRKEFAFARLESMDLSFTKRITARAILEIMPKNPNLTTLHLRGMDMPLGIVKKMAAKHNQVYICSNDSKREEDRFNGSGYSDLYTMMKNPWNACSSSPFFQRANFDYKSDSETPVISILNERGEEIIERLSRQKILSKAEGNHQEEFTDKNSVLTEMVTHFPDKNDTVHSDSTGNICENIDKENILTRTPTTDENEGNQDSLNKIQ